MNPVKSSNSTKADTKENEPGQIQKIQEGNIILFSEVREDTNELLNISKKQQLRWGSQRRIWSRNSIKKQKQCSQRFRLVYQVCRESTFTSWATSLSLKIKIQKWKAKSNEKLSKKIQRLEGIEVRVSMTEGSENIQILTVRRYEQSWRTMELKDQIYYRTKTMFSVITVETPQIEVKKRTPRLRLHLGCQTEEESIKLQGQHCAQKVHQIASQPFLSEERPTCTQ